MLPFTCSRAQTRCLCILSFNDSLPGHSIKHRPSTCALCSRAQTACACSVHALSFRITACLCSHSLDDHGWFSRDRLCLLTALGLSCLFPNRTMFFPRSGQPMAVLVKTARRQPGRFLWTSEVSSTRKLAGSVFLLGHGVAEEANVTRCIGPASRTESTATLMKHALLWHYVSPRCFLHLFLLCLIDHFFLFYSGGGGVGGLLGCPTPLIFVVKTSWKNCLDMGRVNFTGAAKLVENFYSTQFPTLGSPGFGPPMLFIHPYVFVLSCCAILTLFLF